VVHLDRVVLDIDADPEGGLLGQLLCAIAGEDGLGLGDILDALDAVGMLLDFLDLVNDLLG
jgi:hypothetical protein